MHCFASSEELAIKAVELGLYISFSGIVTFKNAKVVQEVARFTPRDRVLVETDSPFLSPEPYRGQKNEPARTRFVVKHLAKLWDISVEEVSSLTTDNFSDFLRNVLNIFMHYELIQLCLNLTLIVVYIIRIFIN